VAQEAVGEAEAARSTRFARRSAPSGRTAEAAAELASESPTAAAVAEEAAAASAEDVEVEEIEESGADDEHPYGEGSHVALEDGSAPDGFEIKGNDGSKLYHVPGSSHYKQTAAEVWFATAEDAEAAGFQLPPSQRESAESADESE
jgi:large subunit ribosomal protein L17